MVKSILFCIVLVICISCYALGKPTGSGKQDKITTDGCVCENFTCSCCADLVVPQVWLNDTVCIMFGYEPNQYGISFIVTIDGKALINETISATNPPPICFPVPVLEDFVDGCVHFYDLSISNTKFHGCVQLELRMWWIYVVSEFKLGCFDANNLSKEHTKLLKFVSKAKDLQAFRNKTLSLNHI